MAITTRTDVFTNMGQGKGYTLPFRIGNHSSATTAGTSTSGLHSPNLFLNSTGTTQPGTLVGLPLPTSLSAGLFHVMSHLGINGSGWRSYYLAYIYTIGTLTTGATGDNFTHDAATFPLLRTQLGQASQPVSLFPLLYITVAPSVTAPAFIMKTGAGGTGYKNQAGSNIVGTNTFTYPSATTTVASAFFIPLEVGDTAVQDVVAINVTTAGSSSPTATVYGIELLAPAGNASGLIGTVSNMDSLFGGLVPADLAPAVATTGTVTSMLGIIGLGANTNGLIGDFYLHSVLNV